MLMLFALKLETCIYKEFVKCLFACVFLCARVEMLYAICESFFFVQTPLVDAMLIANRLSAITFQSNYISSIDGKV